MPLTRLAHYLVFAEDLEKSKDFYVDLLELKVGERPPFPFPGYWLYLDDIACVHMAPASLTKGQIDYLGEAREVGTNTGAVDHIAFSATNLADFIARAEAQDIDLIKRIVPEDGSCQIFFRDPDGIKIELTFSSEEAHLLQ